MSAVFFMAVALVSAFVLLRALEDPGLPLLLAVLGLVVGLAGVASDMGWLAS